nr:MAG TPA: hypothetical protein [Caudoviricetes sp.]
MLRLNLLKRLLFNRVKTRRYTILFYLIKLYRYLVAMDLRIIDMFHTFRILHQIQKRHLFQITENFRTIVLILYRENGLHLQQ